MGKKHTISSSFMFFDILWHSLTFCETILVSARCSKRSISIFRERFNSSREALQVTAGHIVTVTSHGKPQRCGVGISLGSQLETLQETTHLKLLLVKKPQKSARKCDDVRWCEMWTLEMWTRLNKWNMWKDTSKPRCAKMCQDVPRLQLFFHHSYSSFAFLLENVKRSKLRTSCFFTAAVAVPDFCFLMFPSFLDVPSFHWLCSLASSLSAWAFTTLSAQKSER